MPAVYADAGPLISLARIGRLDLLPVLNAAILVTEEVWAEATGDPELPGAVALLDAARCGAIRVVREGNASDHPDLDLGEVGMISAAMAARSAVLIDDLRARKALRRAGGRYIGTVGLILLARRVGAVPTVQPILDSLRRETFRLSPRVYEDALRIAGEWPPASE